MKFRTIVEQSGKTATGLRVPPEVVASLGTSKKPAVNVTINGYTYRSTIAMYNGAFMLPLSAENRAGAGVTAGDEIDIEVELDTELRLVTLPLDFATVLDADPDARRRFESLSYSMQRQHVLSIEGAKTAETRQRRIDKALATLRESGT